MLGLDDARLIDGSSGLLDPSTFSRDLTLSFVNLTGSVYVPATIYSVFFLFLFAKLISRILVN